MEYQYNKYKKMIHLIYIKLKCYIIFTKYANRTIIQNMNSFHINAFLFYNIFIKYVLHKFKLLQYN